MFIVFLPKGFYGTWCSMSEFLYHGDILVSQLCVAQVGGFKIISEIRKSELVGIYSITPRLDGSISILHFPRAPFRPDEKMQLATLCRSESTGHGEIDTPQPEVKQLHLSIPHFVQMRLRGRDLARNGGQRMAPLRSRSYVKDEVDLDAWLRKKRAEVSGRQLLARPPRLTPMLASPTSANKSCFDRHAV